MARPRWNWRSIPGRPTPTPRASDSPKVTIDGFGTQECGAGMSGSTRSSQPLSQCIVACNQLSSSMPDMRLVGCHVLNRACIGIDNLVRGEPVDFLVAVIVYIRVANVDCAHVLSSMGQDQRGVDNVR